MKPPRFIMSAHGLVLETPVPLTPMQRVACATFARDVYGQRYRNLPPGDRRDGVGRVLDALKKGDFVERPVPQFDSEKEVILHGE